MEEIKSGAMTSVDYQLKSSDFLAIYAERRRLLPDPYSRYYWYLIVPVLGVGLALMTQSFLVTAIFSTLYVAIGYLVHELSMRFYKRNYFSDESLSFHTMRRTATLSKEGMRFSSKAAEVLYFWEFVQEISRNSDFVYISLTRVQRIHIPVRAFAGEEQIQIFLSVAQSYRREAQNEEKSI